MQQSCSGSAAQRLGRCRESIEQKSASPPQACQQKIKQKKKIIHDHYCHDYIEPGAVNHFSNLAQGLEMQA